MQENSVKIMRFTSPSKTLLSLNVGESTIIRERDCRYMGLYQAAQRLKKKGYGFEISCKGLIDRTRVTRLA